VPIALFVHSGEERDLAVTAHQVDERDEVVRAPDAAGVSASREAPGQGATFA